MTHEDVHIKPEHQAGEGPLQVATAPEPVHAEESSDNEDVLEHDDCRVEQDGEDGEEEQLDQESYRALK